MELNLLFHIQYYSLLNKESEIELKYHIIFCKVYSATGYIVHVVQYTEYSNVIAYVSLLAISVLICAHIRVRICLLVVGTRWTPKCAITK